MLNFKIFVPIIVIASTIFLYLIVPAKHCQLFSIQAQSFIEGRLDIPQSIDAAYKNGKYYWPQGPFPSLLLIPFQIVFGPGFNQSIAHPFLVIILAILLYRLASLKKFEPASALLLTYAFLFGSQTIGIIRSPCYSYFAHIITMTLLTAVLLEFESKRRPLILGLLLSAIITTRLSAGFIFIPIIYHYLYSKNQAGKFSNLALFITPLVISAISLLLFNHVRFQNFFDNGYSSNDVGDYLDGLRSIGLFSIQHIPTNFYYYFLISVQPVIKESTHLVFPFVTYSTVGLSFFIVSPFFLYTFKSLLYKSILIKLYWLVILMTLLMTLTYYSAGWDQFGPRFLSDIMPIFYLLLLNSLAPPRLNTKQNLFILFSSLLNTYLLITGFLIYKRWLP